MVVTITTDPTPAVAGVRVRIIASGTAGDVQRVRIAGAPTGSRYHRADGSEVQLPTVTDFPERIGTETILFTPDVAGAYSLVIEDWQVAATRKASYQNSPNRLNAESLLTRTAVTLNVANKLTTRLGIPPDTATLTIHVAGNAVVQLDGATHTEASPRLDGYGSELARSGALASATASSLASLIGYQPDGDGADIANVIGNMLSVMSAHMLDTEPHVIQADETNAAIIDAFSGAPDTIPQLIYAGNELRRALSQHIGSADGYHTHADADNRIIAPFATDAQSLRTLLVDMWRAYENHRQSTSVHDSADNENSLASLPAVMALEFNFIAGATSSNVNLDSNENEAAEKLVATQGFVRK